MFRLILSLILISPHLESTEWLQKKAEGWAWYEDSPINEKRQKEEKENIDDNKNASEKIKEIRQNLEEKLSVALLDPTPDNLRTYMELQQKWINQSAQFALLWSQILLNSPELDSTIHNPVSQYGIQLHKKIEDSKKKELIKNLAEKNGLFFFYKGNDKISQAQSMVLTVFLKEYEWKIVPISADGVFLPNFPQSKKDNGIIKKMNVTVFPAIYIVSPIDFEAKPISHGFVTLDQLEKNIILQYQEPEEP